MKKNLLSIVFVLGAFVVSMNAQTILLHDTGPLKVSAFDNGLIGHDGGFTQGAGVKFNGNANDAMYTAGFLIGKNGKANGHVGSFSIADMTVLTPFSGFSSNTHFNQIAECIVTDGTAPTPSGVNMKITSASNTGDKFVLYKVGMKSTAAQSNIFVGIFADWDVGAANYLLNRGGYDPSKHMAYMYENGGANDPAYYGIVGLTGWSGARVTTAGASASIRDSSYAWMTTFLNEPITANGDYRMWVGAGPFSLPANAEVVTGFALVAGATLADLQANAAAAHQKWMSLVPVELTSFTAKQNGSSVNLNWTTATETNNSGFEIQRSINGADWVAVGFKQGMITTSIVTNYNYSDDISGLGNANVAYRLKQLDLDGRFAFSDEVEVDLTPMEFVLEQNYPNPFNPATSISFSIAESGLTKLTVYNSLGQVIAQPVNEILESGYYQIPFDASSLASGTYYYRLESGVNAQIKKMVLMK